MLTEAVIVAARETLGTRESPPGSNDGPEIRLWLADVGIMTPAAWCAAWAYGRYKVAAQRTGLLNPCPRTGSSLRCWELADPAFRHTTPKVGGLSVFKHLDEYGKPDGRGHVEIVQELKGNGWYRYIGGNTSGDGERNGNAVAEGDWQWITGKRGRLVYVGTLVFEQEVGRA